MQILSRLNILIGNAKLKPLLCASRRARECRGVGGSRLGISDIEGVAYDAVNIAVFDAHVKFFLEQRTRRILIEPGLKSQVRSHGSRGNRRFALDRMLVRFNRK